MSTCTHIMLMFSLFPLIKNKDTDSLIQTKDTETLCTHTRIHQHWKIQVPYCTHSLICLFKNKNTSAALSHTHLPICWLSLHSLSSKRKTQIHTPICQSWHGSPSSKTNISGMHTPLLTLSLDYAMSSASYDLVIIMPIRGPRQSNDITTCLETEQSTARVVSGLYNTFCLQSNYSLTGINPAFIWFAIDHHIFSTWIQILDSQKRCILGIWQDRIPFWIDKRTCHEIFVCQSYLSPYLLWSVCFCSHWKSKETSVFPTSVQQLCSISGWTPTSRNYLLETFKRSFGTPFCEL